MTPTPWPLRLGQVRCSLFRGMTLHCPRRFGAGCVARVSRQDARLADPQRRQTPQLTDRKHIVRGGLLQLAPADEKDRDGPTGTVEYAERERVRQVVPPLLALDAERAAERRRRIELIEQLRRVLRHTPWQHLGFPCCRRDLIALQLLQYLKEPVRAVQLRVRRRMLPLGQEAEKLRRRHGFDLAPQTADGP